MTIWGYTFDDSVLSWKQEFDEYARDFWADGSGKNAKIGCIVTHGIGGTPANVRMVADALAARGYTVCAPTLAGHGTSILDLSKATAEQWLNTERAAYDKLKAAGCERIVAIGLSLGGILTGLIAEERDCACAVMISPPVRMKRWLHLGRMLSPFSKGVRYPEEKKEERAKKLPYSQMYNGFSPRALQQLYKLMKRLRRNLKKVSCPVYAVWAELDDKVAEGSKKVLRRGLKHIDYKEFTVKGAAHGSTYDPNVRDEVAKLVADYVDKTIKA